MQSNNHYEHNRLDHFDHDRPEYSKTVLINGGLVFAACVFLASLVPLELAAALLSNLLSIGAYGFLLTAVWRDHSISANHLIYWDVAAFFQAMSIALTWLIDPEAVRSVVAAHNQIAGLALAP